MFYGHLWVDSEGYTRPAASIVEHKLLLTDKSLLLETVDMSSGVLDLSYIGAAKRNIRDGYLVRTVRTHVMKEPQVWVEGSSVGNVLGTSDEAIPTAGVEGVGLLSRNEARFCLNHLDSLYKVSTVSCWSTQVRHSCYQLLLRASWSVSYG